MSDDAKVTLGKGRPTPKRSDAQKRRGGPVEPPPTSRREAAKRLRVQQAQDRRSVRAGTMAGDQSKMLRRDAGPLRSAVRDHVDGRRNAGVVMLPVALLLVAVQFSGDARLLAVIYRVWTVVLLVVIGDLLATAYALRRLIKADFPAERRTRGHLFYGLIRSTVFRRFRMPPPRVRPAPLLRR